MFFLQCANMQKKTVKPKQQNVLDTEATQERNELTIHDYAWRAEFSFVFGQVKTKYKCI